MPSQAVPAALRCEGPGLSEKALALADDVVYISQFGSVRSINAGAAAAPWPCTHGLPNTPYQACSHAPTIPAAWIGGLIVTRKADIK